MLGLDMNGEAEPPSGQIPASRRYEAIVFWLAEELVEERQGILAGFWRESPPSTEASKRALGDSHVRPFTRRAEVVTCDTPHALLNANL